MAPNQPSKQDVARVVGQLFLLLDMLDIKALRAYIDILELERDDVWGSAMQSHCQSDLEIANSTLATAEYILEQVQVLLRYRMWRARKKQEFYDGQDTV